MRLKNSINAIILVTFIFIFSICLSLISGLSIDNLKTPFGKIGYIYFKIYPKIEVKIKNSTLNFTSNNSSKNSSTQINLKNINKIIQLIPKFISKIEIENMKTDSFLLKKLIYKNGHITLISNKIKLFGYLEKNHLNLEIPEYNSNITLNFKIPLKAHIVFKNQMADLNINFNKNIAFIKGEALINNFSENNITITYANPTIDLKFNMDNYKLKGNLYSKYIGMFIKNYLIALDENKIEINNYYHLHSNSINIISNNTNIFAYNNTFSYDKKLIFSKIKKIKGHFEDYKFNINNLLLTYKDLNNTFLKTGKTDLSLFNINNKLNSFSYIKFNKFEELSINEINSTSKKFHFNLNSKKIEGNLNELFSNLIEGNYSTIKTKFFLVNEKIKKNVVSSKYSYLDKIKVNNLIVQYLPILEVNFSTTSKFNRDFFETISKIYKLEIPFEELKGKNNTFVDVKYDYNNSLKYFAKSSIKNLEANLSDLNLSAKQVNIFANNQKDEINISNALIEDFNLSFNSNIEYQNNFIDISNLINYSYYPFIDIKNFHLNALYDLNKSIITLKEFNNSSINLNKNLVSISTIKPLLKYTPLNKVLNDGKIQYDLKNQKLIASIDPKYPIFLEKNSSKHKKMDFIIDFQPYLEISAPYAYIKKEKDTFITLYNMDINLSAALKNYEELKDTIDKIPSSNSNTKTIIKAVNVNYLYDSFKILSDNLKIIIYKETNLTSTYKKSTLKAFTKKGYLLAKGDNFSKEELLPSFPFLNDSFSNLNLNFNIIQTPDNILSGNLIIKNMIAKDLKTLNNIVAFLNTIPALLSLKSPGYSAKGYKGKGKILFLLYQNNFYLKQIEINGKNLAFKGRGYINLKDKTIKLKISALMKMKVKNIPILGKGLSYILFGKDHSITVKIVVKGKLDNPTVSQDLGESLLLSPFNIIKRIITLPAYLFEN